MPKRKKSFTQAIEEEQLRLLSEASSVGTESADYTKLIESITKLDTVKTKKTVLSKDAIFSGLASVAGMALVLNYERIGAVTTKAFGLNPKP